MAMEQKLDQSIGINLSLEKQLKAMQAKVAELQMKLKKKKKRLHSLKQMAKDNLKKSDDALAQKAAAEKRAELAEQKAKSAKQRAHRAIEEYKKSTAFDDEMTKAGVESYKMGFGDCLDKVLKLYLDLDISKVTIDDINEEDKAAEQAEDVPPSEVDDQSGQAQTVTDPDLAFEAPEQVEDQP